MKYKISYVKVLWVIIPITNLTSCNVDEIVMEIRRGQLYIVKITENTPKLPRIY